MRDDRKPAAGYSVGTFVPFVALVAWSPRKSKRGDSDGARVGTELCSLDHDRLRDSKSRSVRFIPDLSQQPFCNRDGDPTERGQPTDHRDGDCGQIAGHEEPAFHSGTPDGSYLHGHIFRQAVHGTAPFSLELRTVVRRSMQ
jgi:hypothetical protein